MIAGGVVYGDSAPDKRRVHDESSTKARDPLPPLNPVVYDFCRAADVPPPADKQGCQTYCAPSRRCTFRWISSGGMCNLTLSGADRDTCREHGDRGIEITPLEHKLMYAALGDERWVHLTPPAIPLCAPSQIVYVASKAESKHDNGICIQSGGVCICTSDRCQQESTRIYSFNDPKLDKCWKALPCPDHFSPPIDTMRSYSIAEVQPAPVANDLPAVWGLVMKDMVDRDQTGRKRYGLPLQPHNGRDALTDAYEEALDLVVYLRQAIYERDNPRAT